MQRQAEELEAEMAEYELIKSGKVEIKVTSIFDLGQNLVNARIKSGMNRVTLAKRLNISEDQILIYEAWRYSIIEIPTLQAIAKILDVEIPDEVIPSKFDGKMSGILAKLKKSGLDRKFVLSRFISPETYDKVMEQTGTLLDQYTLKLYKHLNHIFGWTWENLLSPDDLPAPIANTASVKFKVESNLDPKKINIYSVYARFLAEVLTDYVKDLPKVDIPVNAIEMRTAIIASYGSINLENTLNYAWDCGVIVFPMNEKGNFHGACMRIKGRNVIILNPRKRFIATWLFDLLHELSHAGQEPDKESFGEIEEVATSHKRRTSKEEVFANDFANAVLLGKETEDLFNRCIEQADGKLNMLKKVIPQVARENHVIAGALANYVAHEAKADTKFKYKELLKMAESLQLEEGNPYEMTRKIFHKRGRLKTMQGIDVDILFQALEDV